MDYGSSEKRAKRLPEQTAVLTLTTVDGRTFRERVDFPKGEPENPLTEEEFRSRYDALMAYGGVMPAVSKAVFDTVYGPDVPAAELIKEL